MLVQYRDADGDHDLYALEADVERPLASLTKTMTAVTALQYADIVDQVTVTIDAIAQEGDHGLADGLRFPVEEAVSFMMQSSSNDMAYAVQESVSEELIEARGAVVNVFVKEMNNQASLLGMENTFFIDAIGFDESERLSGSYGTPYDMAKLLWHVTDLYPDIAAASVRPKASYFIGDEQLNIENTNPILEDYEEITFSKTGFTDLAGGNLTLVADTPEGRVVIVLMGSTFNGRFADARIILDGIQEWSEYSF